MGIQLKVLLEPDLPCYYSGLDVTGRVVVSVTAIASCRAILVRAKGSCGVEFGEGDDHTSDGETYFEDTVTVWSGTNFGDNLAAGEFSFPFQFRIPPNVPSTFEGTYGHIRYWVEAKAETPWGTDSEALARFKISSNVDLSQDPSLIDGLPLNGEDTICCCCCEEGPVIMALSAEKKGYIPGEYILLSGEIINNTDTPINDAKISLKETIRYKSGCESKKNSQVLREMNRTGVGAGRKDVWMSLPIHIPESAICLRYCNLISVEHMLKVVFNLGFASDVGVQNDIIIGHSAIGRVTHSVDGPGPGVPAYPTPAPTSFAQNPPTPFNPALNTPAPYNPTPNPTQNFPPPSTSTEDLPPSYSECVASAPPMQDTKGGMVVKEQPKSIMQD